MRKEVIARANERALHLAQTLAAQGQVDLYRVHERKTVISEYVMDVLKREGYVTTVTLYDANDRPVGHWTQKWGAVFHSGPGFHQPGIGRGPSGQIEPPGEGAPTIRVSNLEQDRFVAVPIPGPDGRTRGGAVQVGIDEHRLGREIDELRRSLLIKIVAGAVISVLLLLISFVYVIRLLRKTRRLEAEAQMADRLAYVGILSSGLAHEIRNPLNAMNLNLQMLEEDMHAGGCQPDPEAVSLLASTKREVKRLETLVNDFLSYARPTPPRFESRDVNETVEAVVRFLRADLQQKGIRIETVLLPSLPQVDIDDGQFRQALMNLLINAEQALGQAEQAPGQAEQAPGRAEQAPGRAEQALGQAEQAPGQAEQAPGQAEQAPGQGGRIELVTGLGAEGEVTVQVRDNGPGIPRETQRKIFEVFYSTRGGGTGLGLPIALRILESHGGWITLDSEPGHGTTFTLHVPRSTRPESGSAPAVAHAR